jgi:hypothetical protein
MGLIIETQHPDGAVIAVFAERCDEGEPPRKVAAVEIRYVAMRFGHPLIMAGSERARGGSQKTR